MGHDPAGMLRPLSLDWIGMNEASWLSRWVKRVMLVMAGGVGVLVLLWIAWAWYAQHMLNVEIAKLRARGEPLKWEDLRLGPLPDEQNAVVLLKRAGKEASAANPNGEDVPASSAYSCPEQLPYPAKWHQMMRNAYPAHAKVYPLVRQAQVVGQGVWEQHVSYPTQDMAWMRELANILGDTALYHHFQGNDQEAVATLQDLYFLADAVDQQPSFTSKLVGIGIRMLAMHRTMVMTTELRLESKDNPAGAKREAVLALMRRLGDEEATRRQLIEGLSDDRVWELEMLNAPENRAYVVRPAHLLDAAAGMRNIQRGIEGIEHPSLPYEMPWRPGKPSAPGWSGNKLVLQYLTPITHGWDVAKACTQLWVMHSAEHRCTLIALAVALYRCDHGGYPSSLAELVPMYLDAVPKDPTALDGGEIRYWLAAGGKRPMLCLAGDDAVVQTKDESTIPTHVMYGRQYTTGVACDDQFRDLSAWVDPNPPPVGSEPEPTTLPAGGQN